MFFFLLKNEKNSIIIYSDSAAALSKRGVSCQARIRYPEPSRIVTITQFLYFVKVHSLKSPEVPREKFFSFNGAGGRKGAAKSGTLFCYRPDTSVKPTNAERQKGDQNGY